MGHDQHCQSNLSSCEHFHAVGQRTIVLLGLVIMGNIVAIRKPKTSHVTFVDLGGRPKVKILT